MDVIAEELEKYKNGTINGEELYDSLRWYTKEISEEIVDQTRWSTIYEYVVEDEAGKFYKFYRGMGSTECQENDEFDVSSIVEVKPVQKIVTVYEEVK